MQNAGSSHHGNASSLVSTSKRTFHFSASSLLNTAILRPLLLGSASFESCCTMAPGGAPQSVRTAAAKNAK